MGARSPSAAAIVSDWHARPVREKIAGQNALTIDVEDYFQVEALSGHIMRESWDSRECRIESSLRRILALCRNHGAKGTFFTLGWIARRYPKLVREIVSDGHELASHGYDHLRADRVGRDVFARDISDAKKVLEDISGQPVHGYRAPCFSISQDNLWALEVVGKAGYRYSSSIYPIRHDAYGFPAAPRHAFRPFADDNFLEIPVTSLRALGSNWPCGGGGYFRLLPLSWSLRALDRVTHHERRPCVFYFHPWEMDPDQPRIASLPLKSRLRHYANLERMEGRIRKLLERFLWNRMDAIFPVATGHG
jgi:polysaccharide deacetylase family protein (PEP-CTERM system associated)